MIKCPATNITNVVWLVSGLHSTTKDQTAHAWRQYAHNSRRGSVVRMNGEEWTPTSQPKTETRKREASLSTLATAVGKLRKLHPSLPEGSHLVMFMHGTYQELDKKPYGILQSRGQTITTKELEDVNQKKTDIKDINGNPQDFKYLKNKQYVYCMAYLAADEGRYNAEKIMHIGDGTETPKKKDLPQKENGDNRYHIHGMITNIDVRNNNILIKEKKQKSKLVHAYKTWDGRLLPLDWGEPRTENEYYMRFVNELKAWKEIRHVHLYGCSMGRRDTLLSNAPWGLLDLAKDIDKGVWAFTNFTAIDLWKETKPQTKPQTLKNWKFRICEESHNAAKSATVIGACFRWGCPKNQGRHRTWPDRGYRKVFLCTSMGRLLGFSVRAIKAHLVKDGKLTGKKAWVVEIVKPNGVEQWKEKGYRYAPKFGDPPPNVMGHMILCNYMEPTKTLTAKTCNPNECPFKTNNHGVVCP